MSTRAASVSPVLHALLERVVDFAGLFPPAALSMHDAVAEYATQRNSSYAWMLGRFVVPVTRLEELAAEVYALHGAGQGAWRLTALAGSDPAGDVGVIHAYNRKHSGRLAVDSVELRATTDEAIERALSHIDDIFERYVEIPLEEDPRPLLHAIRRNGGNAKARTGGVTPDVFPTPFNLARFIVACAELDVPFKATAGLHHPLRGEQRLSNDGDAVATMFGFLDVFAAAALARNGADESAVIQLLEERDARAFSIDGGTLRWRDQVLDTARVSAARRHLARSFGSCSFREPVDDLHRLGIL